MEQIHCMVSKEAKVVLLDYQRDHEFKKQGDALEDLLLKCKEPRLDMIEFGVTLAIGALKGDLLIEKELSTCAVASEVMRRYADPVSDPNPINKMIEGGSGD